MQLTPQLLLSAYAQGMFPMADGDQIYWYAPTLRGVIPLDQRFNLPKSLRRAMRKTPFRITVDYDFRGTMEACAAPAPGRETTWINEEFFDVYTQLHKLGYAHSVETWLDDTMVGGLYGVALRGLFAGESMWSRATNASKVALIALVEQLRAGGFVLLDTQWSTPHLQQFGTLEVPRAQYKRLLTHALSVEGCFPSATHVSLDHLIQQ